ncbi:hypothetical protein Y032_0394g640 [Ancylostoma ceylanicum]|uniref:Uncharacterized protein n=1 Tax=Ancylostoma ceylanicum TaxID=53326 RepID=A0A016RSX0_9BILA|nr:hypothetical protein Y032_0394g640 [Ancylostoma ceylanicum]
MKQREILRKTRNEGAFSHASTAWTSFALRIYARIVTNSCGCAHSLPYTVQHPIYSMIHWAKPLVACQINSVNWRGGHQNGHARPCVHGSISADRPLFSVSKLRL